MCKQTGVLLSVFALTAVVSAAGPEPKYRAPRTESGQPDLRGVWNFSSDVPLQRPSAFKDQKVSTPEEFDKRRDTRRNALKMVSTFAPVEAIGLDWLDYASRAADLRTSLITYPENGRLPKLVDGVQRLPNVDEIIELVGDAKNGLPPELLNLLAAFMGGRKDGAEDFSMSERCLFGAGAPFVPNLDNNYLNIVQSRNHVVLLTDIARRIVPLDARPNLGDKLRGWSGESRGRWDGDTLVVETRHYSRRPTGFAGAGNAYEKVVTERFTRISSNTLGYEATIVDPKSYQDKIVMSLPMTRVDTSIYEWACHEGNYSLKNALSGMRAEEQAAAKAR